MKFYQVGGSIRDALLNLQPHDIDYAVEAESYDAMKNYLLEQNYTIHKENSHYGSLTAKCPITNITCDYTICRIDGPYLNFRGPSSFKVGSIKEDLFRRDFTMNAIAKIDEELYDPYHGIKDINQRLIRCVGHTGEKLLEDPLRGLRALRFAIVKNFRINEDILTVLNSDDYINRLLTLSEHLIRNELQKMFSHDTVKSLSLLSSLNVKLLSMIFKSIQLLPKII